MNRDPDSCHWQGLDGPMHAERYRRIAALATGRILDVGCGEAVLLKYLPKGSRYHGLEPSPRAVVKAVDELAENHADGWIIQTSAELHQLVDKFDTVIFNEVLYYAEDPVALLKKYAAALLPGGLIVISIYQKPERPSLWNWIRRILRPRRPVSNLHCTEIVLRFIRRSDWWSSMATIRDPLTHKEWLLIQTHPRSRFAERGGRP